MESLPLAFTLEFQNIRFQEDPSSGNHLCSEFPGTRKTANILRGHAEQSSNIPRAKQT